MRELHRLYGERVRIVELLVRQAHPGERHGAYGSYEDKLGDASSYLQEEHVPWPVLSDDLMGTVQRAYGGLAAAVYLIDSRGIIAAGPGARPRRSGRRSMISCRVAASALQQGKAPTADRIWPPRSWPVRVDRCEVDGRLLSISNWASLAATSSWRAEGSPVPCLPRSRSAPRRCR
jgi:hypothetical protein